jgi:signal transduction histidine kinase
MVYIQYSILGSVMDVPENHIPQAPETPQERASLPALLAELRRRNREAVALHEIGREISSSVNVDQVLDLIARNICWVLECECAGVGLLDSSSSILTWHSLSGAQESSRYLPEDLETTPMLSRVTSSREPVQLKAPNDPSAMPELALMRMEHLTSVVLLPLHHKRHMFGVLMAGRRQRGTFHQEQTRLLANIAGHAGLVLENARLYRATVENARELKALSSRLTVVQEQERSRIARELHDGIGQALTAIRFNLDVLVREAAIGSGQALERVRSMQTIIDETLLDIRRMAFELRPAVLDDFGLAAAIRLYVDRFSKQTGIAVSLSCPDNVGRWRQQIEATVFRVLQEALTNVVKHSGASTVQLRLHKAAEALELLIEDNGRGLAAGDRSSISGAKGLGFVNMRERVAELNGTFNVESPEGTGTRIAVTIPVKT